MARSGWAVLALVASCGSGAGSALEGATWKVMPLGPFGSVPIQGDIAFDAGGNIIVLIDQDAYRFDPAARTWTTLGRPSPVTGQNSPPFRDLDGAVYTAHHGTPNQLLRLDGDQWTPLGPIQGGSFAFGAGNIAFEAVTTMTGTTSTLDLFRGTPPNAVKTFSGPGSAFSLANDQSGHVYLETQPSALQVSPDGTQLLPPFDCDAASQERYCTALTSNFNVDEHGQQEFIQGSSRDGVEFFRLPAGQTHPTLVTNADVSLSKPVIFQVQYDRHGNLYVVGNTDFNETDPTLFVMDDGSSDWHEIGPMALFGKMYDLELILRVRDDGKVFGFDSVSGQIAVLE